VAFFINENAYVDERIIDCTAKSVMEGLCRISGLDNPPPQAHTPGETMKKPKQVLAWITGRVILFFDRNNTLPHCTRVAIFKPGTMDMEGA
jgi:hypothetical protein